MPYYQVKMDDQEKSTLLNMVENYRTADTNDAESLSKAFKMLADYVESLMQETMLMTGKD